MCGRFAQYSPLPELRKTFEIQAVTCTVTPSYNIAPLDSVLVVSRHVGNRLGTFHWGLVPFWAKDTSGAARLINARAETLENKPSFRHAFRKRRCLILADGFYEWKTEGGQKQPWYFTVISGGPFAFAGLWETWKSAAEADYHSCTIVTIDASDSVREIHHRMPVILKPEVLDAWLNPSNQDPKELNEIIRDGHVREMKRFPVSKRVNSPLNNDPGNIEEII